MPSLHGDKDDHANQPDDSSSNREDTQLPSPNGDSSPTDNPSPLSSKKRKHPENGGQNDLDWKRFRESSLEDECRQKSKSSPIKDPATNMETSMVNGVQYEQFTTSYGEILNIPAHRRSDRRWCPTKFYTEMTNMQSSKSPSSKQAQKALDDSSEEEEFPSLEGKRRSNRRPCPKKLHCETMNAESTESPTLKKALRELDESSEDEEVASQPAFRRSDRRPCPNNNKEKPKSISKKVSNGEVPSSAAQRKSNRIVNIYYKLWTRNCGCPPFLLSLRISFKILVIDTLSMLFLVVWCNASQGVFVVGQDVFVVARSPEYALHQ